MRTPQRAEITASPLRASLAFALSYPEIDRVVIGVDSREQLREIAGSLESVELSVPADLASTDQNLINPSRWSTL